MRKISTLFEINYSNNGRKGEIISLVKPENNWVYSDSDNVKATRKFDGTACAIIDGELYKRLDCKIDKTTGLYKKPVPDEAISCSEPDSVTGHHPHWVKCDRANPGDKYFFEGFDALPEKVNRTYELCGPKINGNHEHLNSHQLVPHGEEIINLKDFYFDTIKAYLSSPGNDIEGIVFWHKDGRMCKIRKKDFGIRR